MYEVCSLLLNTQKTSVKKTVIDSCWRSSGTSRSVHFTAWAPQQSSLPCHFLHPLLLLLWGLLVMVRPASLLFTTGRLTNSQNIFQDGQEAMAIIAVSALHTLYCSFSSPCKVCWSPSWPISLKAADPCEEWRKSFESKHHGPERVLWQSLASHSPLS